MRTETYIFKCFSLFLASLYFSCDVDAAPSFSVPAKRNEPGTVALYLNYDPAPPAEEGPPAAAGALRDPAYLPAEIGGIVGSYAVSLVLVAIILLSLSKRRRLRLKAGDEVEKEWEAGPPAPNPLQDGFFPGAQFPAAAQSQEAFPYPLESPRSPVPNFSWPSPTSPTRTEPITFNYPSPTSLRSHGPGVDLAVDQDVVAADRQMAQQQLEDMYKHVMEQEAAKEAGVAYQPPSLPPPPQRLPTNGSTATLSKRERSKPSSLNLKKEEKTQSRTSSILSALKSPLGKKKTNSQAMSISSPIMTPMSGTFPRYEGEEMSSIPPRHYAPAAPPPVPSQMGPVPQGKRITPITPDISPDSTQSIDERLKAQFGSRAPHARTTSAATSERDPQSAVSESSESPLVAPIGLPSSPKPGSTFSSMVSLPSSPKPGSSFSRAGAPSAIRTGGALPLRAYEPALASPSAVSTQTKQTTFERVGPLSPGGGLRTPFTAGAVPYSPYQPFSPVMPITPSLVTKADRKRMRKFEPKTPTVEMVKSSDDVW